VRKLKVLMPLPDLDWDPTEAAVTWKILTRNGIEVRLAERPAGHAHSRATLLNPRERCVVSAVGRDCYRGRQATRARPAAGEPRWRRVRRAGSVPRCQELLLRYRVPSHHHLGAVVNVLTPHSRAAQRCEMTRRCRHPSRGVTSCRPSTTACS